MRSEISRIAVGYSGSILIITRLAFCVTRAVICDYQLLDELTHQRTDPKHMLLGLLNPEMNLFGKLRQVHERCYCLGEKSRYAGPRGICRSLVGLEGNLSRGGRRRGPAVARAL